MNLRTCAPCLLAAILTMGGGACRAEAQPPGPHGLQWYAARDGARLPPAAAQPYSEGIALMNQGQWQAAIARFDLALKHAPDSGAIYESRAMCYQQLGKPEPAIADHTRALKLSPEMAPIIHRNRAVCYQGLGKLDLALADFDKALELAPGMQDPLLLERGRLLVDMGRPEQAEQDFNKALAFPAIRAQAYSELAYLATARKDYPACVSFASRAIEADRKLADAWVNRGVCELSAGRHAEAAKDFTVAIRLQPDFVAAYLNRTAAYAAMGHCRAAAEDANTVARLAPGKAELARQMLGPCAGAGPGPGPGAPERGGARPTYI